MNLRIDSSGKSSAFTGICISALSKRHEKWEDHWCLLYRLRARLSVPVGIVNKREGIQNPTFTGRSSLPQKYSINELIIWKNESVSRSRNWCQIWIGIPVCVMSSEYFKRTSLHLVRLKIFEWINQGNWAGRNFVTKSRVNSRLITHARMHTEVNLKSTTANGSTFE